MKQPMQISHDFFQKNYKQSDFDLQNNLIEHVNNLYHGQEFNKIKLSNQFEKTIISAVLKLTNGKSSII